MTRPLSPRLSEKEAVQRCGWPACRAACCVYGTWVDAAHAADVLAHAELIRPHMPAEAQDPEGWFGEEKAKDAFLPKGTAIHTTVVDDPDHYGGSACIFLRADYKCALQVAGEAAGEHPWRFKPFYCVLHPLDLDARGRITLDEVRHMVDEPASCLRAAEGEVVLGELFAEEIRFLSAVK